MCTTLDLYLVYNTVMEKICTSCNKLLPLDKFAKRSASRDGLKHQCKLCYNAYFKQYLDNNPEAREKHRARVRVSKAKAARQRYGLTEEQYLKGMEELCQCCGKKKAAVQDHCHKSGKFRGFICKQCNTAIGNLNDNADGVWQALDYLLKFEQQ